MERTLWAAMRARHAVGRARAARRRAGADLLQLGHAAGVQHRGRGRGDRVPRPVARRRPTPGGAPLFDRDRLERWTPTVVRPHPRALPMVGAVRLARARRRHRRRLIGRGAGPPARRGPGRARRGPRRCSTATRARTWSAGSGAAGRCCRSSFPLLRAERGIVVDAVLLTPNEASIVFGFSWSYFRVDAPAPARAGRVPPLDHAVQAGRRAVQRHRVQQARQDRAVPQPDGLPRRPRGPLRLGRRRRGHGHGRVHAARLQPGLQDHQGQLRRPEEHHPPGGHGQVPLRVRARPGRPAGRRPGVRAPGVSRAAASPTTCWRTCCRWRR